MAPFLALIFMAVLAHASYSYFSKRTHPTLSSKTTKTRKTIGKSLYVHASSGPAASYVPFANAEATDAVVVDCTHPTQPTFTHHKGHNNPPTIRPSDTSTGLVLNALEDAQNGYAAEHLARQSVTSNHFDADALFSSWAFINRAAALKHAEVLRAAAALHDFREVAGLAGPETLPTAALALCCWINVVERTRFSPPYEEKDADDKFAYFLEHLGPFLESPGAFGDVWRGECDAVMADWRLVEEEGSVHVYGDIGLAVVRCPQPVHYYALFSHSLGCDVVVSIYGNGDTRQYEVEEKYTQFVNVHSRPVQARLDMGPLAAALNRIDTQRTPGTTWTSPRLIDTGPLLRLDRYGQKLSKSQRYGHPPSRPMFASGLTPEEFEAIVESYFRFGLRGVSPRVGGWPWDALHDLNSGIDWAAWEAELPCLLGERE